MGSKENQCSKKRKHTLLNKASVLSTLCDTDTLIIIQDSTVPTQSLIWPQNPDQVHRILNRYKRWNIAKSQRDPKHRKIDPTVQNHSAHDDRVGLLSLIDSKLSLVISKLQKLQNEDGLIGFDPTVENQSHGVWLLQGFDDGMFSYDPTVDDRMLGYDQNGFGCDWESLCIAGSTTPLPLY